VVSSFLGVLSYLSVLFRYQLSADLPVGLPAPKRSQVILMSEDHYGIRLILQNWELRLRRQETKVRTTYRIWLKEGTCFQTYGKSIKVTTEILFPRQTTSQEKDAQIRSESIISLNLLRNKSIFFPITIPIPRNPNDHNPKKTHDKGVLQRGSTTTSWLLKTITSPSRPCQHVLGGGGKHVSWYLIWKPCCSHSADMKTVVPSHILA